MDNKLYELTVTEAQLRVIQIACEDFLRTRLGQFWDLTDDLMLAKMAEKDIKSGTAEWEELLARRHTAKQLMEEAYRLAVDRWLTQKTGDMLIAEDVFTVIRHARWLEKPEKEREDMHWSVDAVEPLIWSGEPPVKVRRAGKERKDHADDE